MKIYNIGQVGNSDLLPQTSPPLNLRDTPQTTPPPLNLREGPQTNTPIPPLLLSPQWAAALFLPILQPKFTRRTPNHHPLPPYKKPQVGGGPFFSYFARCQTFPK
ncbi:hypothetical protein AMTRI_Chr09g15230 [Amborella trichopoda]